MSRHPIKKWLKKSEFKDAIAINLKIVIVLWVIIVWLNISFSSWCEARTADFLSKKFLWLIFSLAIHDDDYDYDDDDDDGNDDFFTYFYHKIKDQNLK